LSAWLLVGASTFSLAALSSSAPIGQPSVALPIATSIWARLIPPECAVPGYLLQVLADRRRFLPQRRQVDAALLDRDQISGIST